MNKSRIVGIDYGRKRVGLAVADPLRIFATPLGTYPPREAVARLESMHADVGIETAVVGWPLMPDGSEGVATRWVQEYLNRLKKALPDVRWIKWDERYSSERAKAAIFEAGVKRKGRREKGRVDAAAAAIILQEYLDETRGTDQGSINTPPVN